MKRTILTLAITGIAILAYANAPDTHDADTIYSLQTAIGFLLTIIIGGMWYSLRQIHKKLDGQDAVNAELFKRIRVAEDKANKVMAQHQIAVEAGMCPAMMKLASVCKG